MGAGEHQREPPVGDRGLALRRYQFVADQLQRLGGQVRGPAAPRAVNQPTPRGHREPAFRIGRHARCRPDGERGGKSIGKRVLSARHVAGPSREESEEPTVALSRRVGRGGSGKGFKVGRSHEIFRDPS